MGTKAAVFLILAASGTARAEWAAYRAPPIEILSNAGDKSARQVLTLLDQQRWLAGQLLGRAEIAPLWPIRIVVIKKDRGSEAYRTPHLELRRDAYMAGMVDGDPTPRQWLLDSARILLNDAIGPLPPAIENGLIELLANVQSDSTRITLQVPADASHRTRDWSRMQMLAADGGSRVRVFFQNLQQSAPIDTAYRNSFGKTEKEMEAAVDSFLGAGKFEPVVISGKPLNPERDYRPRELFGETGPVALADLLQADTSRKAFLALVNSGSKDPDVLDGAGLYAEATQKDSKNARAWTTYAATLTEPAKSWDALQRAAQLNGRWEEPWIRMAALEKTAERRVPHFRKAIQLAPRHWELWLQLASAQLEAGDLNGATQSWKSAELAAPDPQEQARISKLREQYEEKRADQAEAAKRREQEEKEKELNRLKAEMMASIHAAEAKANAGATVDPNRKVEQWWDDTRKLTSVQGTLERVDCLGSQLRLGIRSASSKLTQYLVKEPGKLMVEGGGELSLSCGLQRPPKKIRIGFEAKPDTKLGTAGEVAVISFQ